MFENLKLIREMNKRGISSVDAKNNTINSLIKLADIKLITLYIKGNKNISINDLSKLVQAIIFINDINVILPDDLKDCSRAIDNLAYKNKDSENSILQLSSKVYEIAVKNEIQEIIKRGNGEEIITYAYDIGRKLFIPDENKKNYVNILADALINLGNIKDMLWFAYGVTYAPKEKLFLAVRNLGYKEDFYKIAFVNGWEDYPDGTSIYERVEIHVDEPMSKKEEYEFLKDEKRLQEQKEKRRRF